MKAKFLAMLMLLALALSGCSAEAAPAMYIEPAQLTEEEEAVAKLLGADMDQHLFDVVLDGAAKKVSIRTYELVDGQWEMFSGGGGLALKEGSKEGRIALGFQDLRKSLREAVSFGSDFFAVTHNAPEENPPEDLGRTTSFLANRTEIVYDREIPVAVQINTAKNEVSSYDPEYFFQPEKYEKLGYEHVYALTVTFSQEPLS